MPTEWPKHSVTALVAMNRVKALHENNSGPKIRAPSVMAPIQSDFPGAHNTRPWTGSQASWAIILSEPATRCMSAPLIWLVSGAPA